jgi:hypothetical protein
MNTELSERYLDAIRDVRLHINDESVNPVNGLLEFVWTFLFLRMFQALSTK